MNSIIDQLKAIDTPTLSNAIEKLKVRNPISGFCSRSMKCIFPELGVMCGYAVTAEVETMSAEPGGLDEEFVNLCQALAQSPCPGVIVLQESGPHPEFSAHCGEVMATTFKRLGAVGLVSDSAVRDIAEVRSLGFHYFAPGAVASHANFRIRRVQVPVSVCGLPIEPGDLLHGDINGLIKVPSANLEKLMQLVERVRQTEAELLQFVKSEDFKIDGLYKRRLSHFLRGVNLGKLGLRAVSV